MESCIGIDLGGSCVKGIAMTLFGDLIAKNVEPFEDRHGGWKEAVRKVYSNLSASLPRQPVSVGLSAPGLAAKDGKSIDYMPGRLSGLEGLNWSDFLKSGLEVPVLNDAHAALLGEIRSGAGKGAQNAVMLTLGTGVGGAAMVDGRLLRGHIGRAGHLGHACLDVDGVPDICGTPGSLELWMGNCTIGERSNGEYATTHELVAAHRMGDAKATQIWLRSVKGLAAALASFINILDPEIAIIGGGIARAEDSLFNPLLQYLDEMEWRPGGASVRIVRASLEEWAGAYGAAWNAIEARG